MVQIDYGIASDSQQLGRDRTPTRTLVFNRRLWKRRTFLVSKLVFDKAVSVLCLPVIALVALVLLMLNPFFNPGPLFFSQTRMGRYGKPFEMIKFRTMIAVDQIQRTHDEGVETSRITPLGRILRKNRIDELPNMLNVLRHEMSIIGPRPDAWDHAVAYSEAIPAYARRHVVFPGITGLAQVRQGYAEGVNQTWAKVRLDRVYIRHQGFRTELQIIFDTIRVVLTGFGAR
jgi:lipopolysaccharide/colanic/teichoic acid biosynthesis glycosyltransferase